MELQRSLYFWGFCFPTELWEIPLNSVSEIRHSHIIPRNYVGRFFTTIAGNAHFSKTGFSIDFFYLHDNDMTFSSQPLNILKKCPQLLVLFFKVKTFSERL